MKKPNIKKLTSWVTRKHYDVFKQTDAVREFNKLLEYVDKLEETVISSSIETPKKVSLKKRQIKISEKNSLDFNLDKAVEELAELILVLTQLRTKQHTRSPILNKEVVDEIGDVKRHLWWLEAHFGKKRVKHRVKAKINKLEKKVKK